MFVHFFLIKGCFIQLLESSEIVKSKKFTLLNEYCVVKFKKECVNVNCIHSSVGICKSVMSSMHNKSSINLPLNTISGCQMFTSLIHIIHFPSFPVQHVKTLIKQYKYIFNQFLNLILIGKVINKAQHEV